MGPVRRRRVLGMRGRVVASFLVLLLAAEVVSVVVLRQVGFARLDEQVQRDLAIAIATADLDGRLREVEGQLGRPGGPTLGSVFDDHLRARPARSDQAYLTFVDREPFAASADAPVALDRLEPAAWWATLRTTESGSTETSVGTARWLAVPVLAGDELLGVFVAISFVGDQQDALQGTIATVALVTLLVLVVACLAAWGAAGRALTPVRDLAAAAGRVSAGADLDAEIEVSGGDEVAALAESINGMLARLRSAFDSQQAFLDGAAHELRTPITIARGHLELLDDDPVQRAHDVDLVLDELTRMERLVTDLRVLARSERPDFLEVDDVDVSTLIADVGQKAATIAPRAWRVVDSPVGEVRADRQRLTQALLGLISNAVFVTTDADTIEIGATGEDDRVILWVRDTGPGIPVADVPTLFDRTGRTVRPRPGGTGLGLPIVAAIAEAHGGTVAVISDFGAGTTFEISIPRGLG